MWVLYFVFSFLIMVFSGKYFYFEKYEDFQIREIVVTEQFVLFRILIKNVRMFFNYFWFLGKVFFQNLCKFLNLENVIIKF